VRITAQAAIDAIKGGKPRPPKVLDPDPVDIPGFDVRVLPASSLEKDRHRTTPDRMIRALRDGRGWVRENAVTVFGAMAAHQELDPSSAGAILAVMARDAVVGVRQAAYRALGQVGTPEALALIVIGLEDRTSQVGDVARQTLRALGTSALPALIDGLSRLAAFGTLPTEEQHRRSVLGLLEQLAPSAPEAVIEALRPALTSDTLARVGALRALRVIGRERAALVRPDVALRESDADLQVAREARATLEHIDGKDIAPAAAPELPLPPAILAPIQPFEGLTEASTTPIDVLLKATQDGRDHVRANAARTVALTSDPPKRAAMSLAILLRDGEPEVRRAAAEALERRGPEFAAPVAFWLTVALQDPDAAIRDRVVNLLAAVHAVSPEALIEALRIDPDLAHATCLVVVDRIGMDAVPTLMRGLKNPSGLIRINAAQGLELLAKRGASEALDLLEARLKDPIGRVRVASQAAIDAIKGGKPRPPKVLEPDPIEVPAFTDRLLDDTALAPHAGRIAVDRLLRALRDGRPFVRGNASTLLGHDPALTDSVHHVVGALAVLARDASIDVRRRAITALGRLASRAGTSPLDAVLAVLTAGLSDPALAVRRDAEQALRALHETAFPALSLALANPNARALPHLVALFLALGDQARDALPDALTTTTPGLHLGALLVLRAFDRDGLARHRAAVAPLADAQDPAVRAAARALLDKIDAKDIAPAALEPTPLPRPDFADHLLSRELLEVEAEALRFDLLAHAAKDGRDTVRANAVCGLGVLGSASHAIYPFLARALKDPSEDVRFRAAEALSHLAPRRDLAFDLVLTLNDGSPRVVTAAEAALRHYRGFAIDAFMYALDDAPEIVGRVILPMFASLGAEALDALVLAQRYDAPLVRLNALRALRLMDRDVASAIRATVALARRDADRGVRLEALLTLDWIDGVTYALLREPRVLPHPDFASPLAPEVLLEATASYPEAALAELLFDGRRGVRENAAAAHGALLRYHPWLPILLKDDATAVQQAAARALLALGTAAAPAASKLIEALSEDDEVVRDVSREALIALHTLALPALIAALWAPLDRARRTVFPILEHLGKDATPAVIAALDHPSQLVTLNALVLLARIYGLDPEGAAVAIPKVTALIRHPLPAIIAAAQKCLFRLEGRTPAEFQKDPVPMPIVGFDVAPLPADVLRPEAPSLDIAWLISALSDGRPVVRENAARAAGYLPHAMKDLLAPLLLALKDSAPEVQIAAADAFATLLSEDDAAIPGLTFALRASPDRVRRACLVTLDAYGPRRVASQLTKHLVGREDWTLTTIGKVAARMAEVLVPALADFAKDPTQSLVARENAVRVIAELGHKGAGVEQKLLALLPEMEGMLAPKAAFAIGRVARPTKDLIAAMLKRLETDPRPGLHKEVRDAVKSLKRKLPPGAA
jgi:HEAT repeat protein